MQDKGFLGSLFDIGFRSFVTTKIVSVLFVIAMVLSAIYTLFLIATAFSADSGAGIGVLVFSPLIFFLFVLYSRVLLEFVVVVFRIYENTSIMATGAIPSGGPGGPPPGFGPPSSPVAPAHGGGGPEAPPTQAPPGPQSPAS